MPLSPAFHPAFESVGLFIYMVGLEKLRSAKKINVERLMTRLDAGMPYDSRMSDRAELEHLLISVKRSFFRRLGLAAEDLTHMSEMSNFAAYCLTHPVDCITFNYDDAFDWALADAYHRFTKNKGQHWYTYDGYGFTAGDIHTNINGVLTAVPDSTMLLLKLHGSVNWRIKLGRSAPYDPEDFFFHQQWHNGGIVLNNWTPPADAFEKIEIDAFMVPPVLTKSAITKEPVLRMIWDHARRKLEQASRVVFVGYSMPPTDIAARFLFAESIEQGTPIDVVIGDKNSDDEVSRITYEYRKLFWAKSPNIITKDARPWLAEHFPAGDLVRR